jgi:hypothetical protein
MQVAPAFHKPELQPSGLIDIFALFIDIRSKPGAITPHCASFYDNSHINGWF